MILRDYQEDAVNSLIKSLKKNDSSLIVAPTGAGKTIILSAIIDKFKKKRY